MARPVTPEAARLSREIKIYCHRLELAELKRRSARCGCSLPSYLRRCALRRQLPSPMPGRNLLARHQLWRVKSNATQIGRALEHGRLVPMPAQWLARLSRRTERVRQSLAEARPFIKERFFSLELPRKQVIKLRVTADDHRRLKTAAEGSGRSLSAFIRTKALARQLPPRIPTLPAPLFEELYEVQREWNEIAHGVNAGRVTRVDGGIFARFEMLYRQALAIFQ